MCKGERNKNEDFFGECCVEFMFYQNPTDISDGQLDSMWKTLSSITIGLTTTHAVFYLVPHVVRTHSDCA